MTDFFTRDDEWQRQLAARFLDPFYRSRGWSVTRYPGEHPIQRLHVDVMLSRDGQIHYIDEKIIRGRRDGQQAEKINLETWSCSVPGLERYGWIAKDEQSEATVIMICFADVSDLGPEDWKNVDILDCVWIPFRPLKNWFWEQGEDRFELQDNQQRNHSLSRKVPIAEVVAANIGLRRFPIKRSEAARAGYDSGFVGYTKDGHLVHYCHCGEYGSFGYGVALTEGKLGTWYCREHRP